MTDKEIIQALELCCTGEECYKCEFQPSKQDRKGTVGCSLQMMKQALDLINRQQAKIESLNNALRVRKNIAGRETVYVEIAKAKAIKELEDKTHKIITDIYNKHIFGRDNDLTDEEKDAIINFSDDIVSGFENIVKEIVGDTE